jgi:signal transduction histidine kinase
MFVKLRLLVLFLCLVFIPTGVVGWMAVRLLRSENEILEKRFTELLEGQLRAYDTRVAQVLERYERRMLDVALTPLTPQRVRAAARSLAECTGVFVLAPDGTLRHPDLSRPHSAAERTLAEETTGVRASGLLLRRESAESDGAPGSWSGANQSRQAGPVGKESSSTAEPGQSLRGKLATNYGYAAQGEKGEAGASGGRPPSVQVSDGWVPWFRDEGLHLYFRRTVPSGETVVFEMNRARIMADVIGILPSTIPGKGARSRQGAESASVVALRDARDTVVYQWGEGTFEEAQGRAPSAAIPLAAPLSAWRLEYYADAAFSPVAATRGRRAFVVAAGTVSLAIFLGLLSAYIYRESTRRMAEAAARVSFVNRVSHELRTPLTNLRLYGDMLHERIEQGDDAKAASYVGTMNDEASRLSRLINNILSFARSERRALRIHPAALDPCALVQGVVRQFQRAFDNCGLSVELDMRFCPQIYADGDACEQILVNLLSNAEKYASGGGSLRISSRREGDDFVLAVCDAGPGIPRGKRERVFAPFVRLSDRIDEGVSGTGMGLSIARDLARLHGGDLAVVDSPKGACFELRLPIGPKSGG